MLFKRKMRMFSLFLAVLCFLFSDVSAFSVHAASYTTTVSNQNGKDGLVDYDTHVDYIIPRERLLLVDPETMDRDLGHVNDPLATVVFQKSTNGSWVTDTNPPFYVSHITEINKYAANETQTDSISSAAIRYDASVGGEWNADGKVFSGKRIRIRFPKAALKSDGTYHDVTMTISNIMFKNRRDETHDGIGLVYQSVDNSLNFSSMDIEAACDTGVTFDVHISVSGASASENLFLCFYDLDIRGFHGFEGSFADNDCIEGIKIRSGIFPGTSPHVPNDHAVRFVDGEQPEYYGTGELGNLGGQDSFKGAVSWLATATGTSFRWAGYGGAGTVVGLGDKDLPSFTVNTQVRTELASSPVSGTKTYGAFHEVDSKWFLSLMLASYSHTYTRTDLMNDESLTSPSDDWIFNYSDTTVGDSGITADKTYRITINRNRYTYSFNANPPSDRSMSSVSGMPANRTVVASKEESGKSDVTVNSPALPGYEFKGWNTKANGSGNAYPGSEIMKSNKTFYAQWERATYTVHFDANGSSNPDHETGEAVQNKTTGTMSDQTLKFDVAANLNASQFAREGYTFAGWNTKADGTGTSYTDKQSVTNLIGYNQSEITLYAQWAKKFGTETIIVISEETGNPVSNVNMTLQKLVNGSWTDLIAGTTGSDGKLIVNQLHWFDYRWVITDVPAGYVKSEDTGFSIRYNRLSATNQVILYMKRVSIVLDSQVSDMIKGERAPAFLYHIDGTDVAGVRHAYHLLVQTNTGSGFGTSRFTDLFAGTYTVTQTPVSRYRIETAVPVSHATADGINASVDVLNYDSAEVKFPYTIQEYGWYLGMDSRTNSLLK